MWSQCAWYHRPVWAIQSLERGAKKRIPFRVNSALNLQNRSRFMILDRQGPRGSGNWANSCIPTRCVNVTYVTRRRYKFANWQTVPTPLTGAIGRVVFANWRSEIVFFPHQAKGPDSCLLDCWLDCWMKPFLFLRMNGAWLWPQLGEGLVFKRK